MFTWYHYCTCTCTTNSADVWLALSSEVIYLPLTDTYAPVALLMSLRVGPLVRAPLQGRQEEEDIEKRGRKKGKKEMGC